MKRIKFEKFKLNWYRVILLITAAILIITCSGLFEGLKNSFLVVVGILVILFDISRLFWYRNYVKYNDKAIVIRINTLLGKTYTFKSISNVKVTSEYMYITYQNEKNTINLHKIDRNDIDDLADILVRKSGAEYVSEVMDEQFYKKT